MSTSTRKRKPRKYKPFDELSPRGRDHRENQVYDHQEKYIREEFGQAAANVANYGWAIDGYSTATKVYGHGVLTTGLDDPTDHSFESF